MKLISKCLSAVLAITILTACFSFTGCANEELYSLSVTGSELLYEDLNDSYKAGEEVTVKVKITPNENTVAYLDLLPLARAKSSQYDFYAFTFTMPNKSAVLRIENEKGFGEPLLTGFYLTFSNDGEPIEELNKELKSPEAVANYYYFYHDEEKNLDVFTSNEGADVFADGKTAESCDSVWGLKEFELESTLYYTYEMLDAVASVDWVYYDAQTRECSLSRGAGYTLGDIGISATTNTQNLSQTLYTAQGKEYEATYYAKVTIKFEYIDYLTAVKVLEYDKNNQLLKSTDFTGKNRSDTFTASANCEYVVIEEEYTVMTGEKSGEKYYERTLVNKTTLGKGKNLKYPCGNGLISPVYLFINWAE